MIGTIGFLFWSAVVLIPAVVTVSRAVRFLRRDRFIWLARCAVVAGSSRVPDTYKAGHGEAYELPLSGTVRRAA
jgi:hypothetical protein